MALYTYLSYRKSCSVWIGKHIDRKMLEDNLLYQTLRVTVKSPRSDPNSCLNIKKKRDEEGKNAQFIKYFDR